MATPEEQREMSNGMVLVAILFVIAVAGFYISKWCAPGPQPTQVINLDGTPYVEQER